jgi:hypothetical protein
MFWALCLSTLGISKPSIALEVPVELFAVMSKVALGSGELTPIWAEANPERRIADNSIILFFIP